MNTGLLRKLQFLDCLVQSLLHSILRLRSPSPQALLKLLGRRRLNENELGIEVGLFDLLDALLLPLASILAIRNRISRQAVEPGCGARIHRLNWNGCGEPTSISMSRMQARPLEVTSLTAAKEVP